MSDMESLRKKAEKRVKRRKEYTDHVTAYVVVNVFLWAIALLTGSGTWPIFATLGWGIGLAFDTVDFLTNSPDRREDAIQKEMARLAAEEGFTKPKREQVARLSEDGEILYEDDEAAQRGTKESR